MKAHPVSYFNDRSSVDATTGCWIWEGAVDRYGYARLSGAGAHRSAFIAANGPIADGMTVDHLCFNTRCVNPAHMRLLSRLENQRNQRSAKWVTCIHGHPFTPENTYIRTQASGGRRQCRTCNREAARKYAARKKAAA